MGAGIFATEAISLVGCDIHDNIATNEGGGVACSDIDSTGIITNCEIHNNEAVKGGGLYALGAVGLVGSDIHDNVATGAGGGAWIGGLVTADDCDIDSNTANSGGGVYFAASGANIRTTRIRANTATTQGGGVYAMHPATLDGCWITGNSATGNGGGALVTTNAGLAMTSCTVSGNRTGAQGGGIYVTATGDAALTKTILWRNDAIDASDLAFVASGGALSFDCSLTNQSGVVGTGTITYIANNKFWDPFFCAPAPATSAPTRGGDYSIAANSPATEYNSWCGARMGAGMIGCPWGAIVSITDVGNDQGRNVRIQWNRAMSDAYGAPEPITQYSVWRRVDANLIALETPHAQAPQDLGLLAPPGIWDFITVVPASAESKYSTVVPTLCDSTESAGPCLSTFLVRAHTGVPAIVFDSPADSGYSVDNLAPGAPQDFMIHTEDGIASWLRNIEDDDFDYFIVYCAPDLSTPIESAGIVAMTTDTSLALPDSTVGMYIFVTAKDFAGNESEESNRVQNSSGTSVENLDLPPLESVLHQNSPNPFNPTTTIRFDIARAGRVTLRVYDVSGRLVRTIIDENLPAGHHKAVWDGRDRGGQEAASGVYFCRLTAGDFVKARKMTLLK
jgi:hypothetical protein